MGDPLDILPAERREGAKIAFASAFGSAPVDHLATVAGGASGAFTYRAEVGGRSYLLRLEQMARSPLRDPARGYACMRIASNAGIAPPLHHADADAGIAIMDFITEKPLPTHPGGVPGVVRDLGGLVAKLQATPVFPALADFPAIIVRLLEVVRLSGMFQTGVLEPHAQAFERIREVYAWDRDALVSSHNDPNPRNILFDGDRLWLVDWETAYRNDPLVDVAIIANEFAHTPELEDALILAALGREPTRLMRARLTLMRNMVRLYYPAIGFSIMIGLPRPAPLDLSAPTVEEFRKSVIEGRLAPGSAEAMTAMGKMMLKGFLDGVATPQFEEALAIVREG